MFGASRAELTVVDAAHVPGEKHGCKCSQGDVAHLQKHQTREEDGPRQSQEAPEEIPSSHSPVGTALGTPPAAAPRRRVSDLRSELFDTCSKCTRWRCCRCCRNPSDSR